MEHPQKGQRFVDVRDKFPNSKIAETIDEWIADETDRRILKRRLIDGLTFSQLSDEFHLCDRQVKNRVYKAQEKLFRHL